MVEVNLSGTRVPASICQAKIQIVTDKTIAGKADVQSISPQGVLRLNWRELLFGEASRYAPLPRMSAPCQ
jgi:hypothetical protein